MEPDDNDYILKYIDTYFSIGFKSKPRVYCAFKLK